jgi:hypothetical protein
MRLEWSLVSCVLVSLGADSEGYSGILPLHPPCWKGKAHSEGGAMDSKRQQAGTLQEAAAEEEV